MLLKFYFIKLDMHEKQKDIRDGGLLRALDLIFVPTSFIRFARKARKQGYKMEYSKTIGLELFRAAVYMAPAIPNFF